MMKSCNITANKEAGLRRTFYRRLCDSPQGADIPLFAQAWWLDAACPDAWTVLTCPTEPDWSAENAGLMAAMPIHTPYGNSVLMPRFTQHTSIWKSSDNQAKEHKILHELAEGLSHYHYVYAQLPTTQRQAQAFYWKGLALNVRYSYRLEELSRWREQGGPEGMEKTLRAGMGRDRRQRLRAAERQNLTVKACTTVEMTILYRDIFSGQGIRTRSDETVCLAQLMETALQRRQGLLWGAYDANGALQAAVFVVWQGKTAYYVAGGSRKQHPAALTLVLFQAIVHCAKFCDIFDFEGSMIENIAWFFSGFGAVPCPYIALCGRQPGLWTRAWRKIGRRFRSRPEGGAGGPDDRTDAPAPDGCPLKI